MADWTYWKRSGGSGLPVPLKVEPMKTFSVSADRLLLRGCLQELLEE